ncbi:MAG TPA: CHAT domain-containing tetratricopeptide repeat protein [Pyrinomonadaceae bacterium]|nr:CHAT domain-containing tetratricopeptide repeat protein [Pyrinomonadaceae bacterium]
MSEIIQLHKSFRSATRLRCAVVLCFIVSGATSARTQEQPSALTVGSPVVREMRGGEQHTYQVTLSAGEHARVVIEQKGIDVVLAVADGKTLLEVDNNLSGTRGLEVISLVAEVTTVYVLKVQSLEKGATAGRYEIRIEDLRTATDTDRTRVAAERAYFAGVKLQGERTGESRRKAIERYNEALRLMRDAGDRRGEAMTLTNLGIIYNILAEPQNALQPLNQALAIWQAVGDRHLEAITLSINGRVYYALGEPQKALEAYSLALPVMRAVGDQSGEAGTSTQIGTVYRLLGEPQKALDYFAQALPLWRALGDRRNEATVLNNMGTVYTLLGQSDKAFNYFQQVLPLARAIGDKRNEAVALSNIGHLHNLLNEPEKALPHLQQALTIAKENGDRKSEALALTNTGTAYSFLRQYGIAVETLERALQLRVAMSDRQGEAITLNHLGRAFYLWNQPQKALEYYEKALPIWRAVGDRNGEVAALYGMANAESDRDDLLEASKRTASALAIINTLRTKVASLDLRASYFASVQDLFKLHIDLLMRLHRRQPAAGFDVAALQAYEQARARSLIDMLAEASADIRQGVDPALFARERSLQQMLNAEADRQIRLFNGQHTEEAASAARRKIDELLTQLLAIEADLKSHSPRYAALTQPEPLGLSEIQTAVTDNTTLLLEYSLGEKRSYLWTVTPTSFSSYELPARATIEAAARRCYELLTARNQFVKFETADEKRERVRLADAEYPKAAAALSEMLLGPVAGQLAGKRLLVVPDGALEYLPFAALTIPRQSTSFVPLMVEHEVTSIPSASTLAILRRELQGRAAAEKVVAVFADPVFEKTDERVTGALSRSAGGHHVAPANVSDELPPLSRLPYTRQEAEAILALVPATAQKAALGFEANRVAAMSEELSRYRIIHFATHSFLDSTHPELSSIALSMLDRQGRPQEGFVRSYEVFNLKLGAELVVLSGCRTGLGKEVKGEGLYGMTRGFMYAGSKRVVVSLWDVQDQATARLMSDFYRGLLGPKRLNPAAALRAAQLATWREGRWQAPYYWAGFVLQGEPK